MARLKLEEVMCAKVLNDRGQSVRATARALGVSESGLRYRLGRVRCGAGDGRAKQASACDAHEAEIVAWIERQAAGGEGVGGGAGRPEGVKGLWERLVRERGYAGSYRSVLRYVARRVPGPRPRPFRRVETAAGAQAQVDWVSREVLVEELGPVPSLLHALVMTLSHSRMWAVVWSGRQDLLSWLECHNRAFVLLGGVALTVRIDNLKTGVARGSGVWAELNPGYASYARQVGFVVDPCRVRRASDKGKVERRGRDLAWLGLGLGGGGGDVGGGAERFATLRALQERTEARVLERAAGLTCPVTGRSVYESWRAELPHLRPLPATLPEPFDVEVSRTVGADCLVSFEGRQYSVPFAYARRQVRVRGCAGRVEVYGEGGEGGEGSPAACVARFPRGTDCRLLIDQSHYEAGEGEGEGAGGVAAPTPLGELAERIVVRRSWECDGAAAAARPIDRYEQLVRSMR